MTKPEEDPNEVPNDHKRNRPDDKVADTSIPDSHADTAKRKNNANANKTNKTKRVRHKLRQFSVSIRKGFYAVGKYVSELFFEDKAAFWTMAFTALLVVVTCLLVVVTDQVDKTTRATQRAFISANGLNIGNAVLDPTTQKIVSYKAWQNWSNSGTTPAIRVVALLNFKSDSPQTLSKDFDFPYSSKIPKMVFEIGAKGIVPSNPFRIPIETVQKLQKHEIRFYIWGEATYYDIFSDTLQHRTEFCSEIANVDSSSFDLTDPKTQVNIDNIACEDHNCHDETCKK